MRNIWKLVALATCALSSPAFAEECKFDLTSTFTASFTLDCSPTNIQALPGSFNIYLLPVTLNGAPGKASINFTKAGTGRDLTFTGVTSADSFNQSFTGPQLYTGLTSAPTFLQGSYSLNGGAASLSISSVAAAVPEPATWAMMLFGFGGMGLAMRRQRKAMLAKA